MYTLYNLHVLQIHFPSFVKDVQETLTELNSQIARGRIRYYGFSNFGPKNLQSYLDAGAKPISNQVMSVCSVETVLEGLVDKDSVLNICVFHDCLSHLKTT